MSVVFTHRDEGGDELVVESQDEGFAVLAHGRRGGPSVVVELDELAAVGLVDALGAELVRRTRTHRE